MDKDIPQFNKYNRPKLKVTKVKPIILMNKMKLTNKKEEDYLVKSIFYQSI